VAVADALVPDLEGLRSITHSLYGAVSLTQWSRGSRGTRTRRCS
jgi:hypothetical protein